MEHLQAYNRKLLANILPDHVAQHFLCVDKNMDVSVVLSSSVFGFSLLLFISIKLSCIVL